VTPPDDSEPKVLDQDLLADFEIANFCAPTATLSGPMVGGHLPGRVGSLQLPRSAFGLKSLSFADVQPYLVLQQDGALTHRAKLVA
jgi:hypothetical protein